MGKILSENNTLNIFKLININKFINMYGIKRSGDLKKSKMSWNFLDLLIDN